MFVLFLYVYHSLDCLYKSSHELTKVAQLSLSLILTFSLRPAPDKYTQKRGLCLLTSLSGCPDPRDVPECDAVDCKRYTSSGTSYSKFALIQLDTCKFQVTRRVSLTDQQDEFLVDDNDNDTTGTTTSTSDDTSAYEQGLRGTFRQQKMQAN